MKDYINYFVMIVKEENILEYLNEFIEKTDDLFQNDTRFHKNNVVYMFFVNYDITSEKIDYIKNVIINQDVLQELPINSDTILPIIYDAANHKCIIKTNKNRLSIKLIHIALRNIYKILK